jgi:hypothetical protein
MVNVQADIYTIIEDQSNDPIYIYYKNIWHVYK